jgi:hypothetical protein
MPGMARFACLLFFGVCLCGNIAMAVEEPPYRVVLQDGPFEVRKYPALIAAEVRVGGDQDEAGNAGFRLLAAYIFGGNHARESIAMTAPVIQSRGKGQSIAMTAPVMQTDTEGAWTVRFIMPHGFTLATLPIPDDERVHLVALEPTTQAVVRFSGLAFAADVAARTGELRKKIAEHHLQAIGPASLARYNPPWTLWFLRRNEVMLPLRADDSPTAATAH